jgi:hypothetical protein
MQGSVIDHAAPTGLTGHAERLSCGNNCSRVP